MPDKSTFREKWLNAFPTFSRIPHCLKRGTCRFASFSWRCWIKSWRYLLGLIVCLIVFDIALGIYATAQLNHQLDLIRQKGEPLTLEELVPPPAPGEINVTNIYRQAQANIHFEIEHTTFPVAEGEDKGTPYDRKYIPTYKNDKQTAAYLAKNAVAIKLIRQASAESNIHFDLDIDPYWGVDIKDVNTSELMHLISLQAIYEAHTGNTNAALQDVRCLFLMARQFSAIPYLGRASRTAIKLNRSNETLAKVLLSTKISPAHARAFEASLPTIDFKSLAERDFLVDRIMCKYWIESLPWPYVILTSQGMTDTSSLTFWRILKLFTTPIQRLDEANALKWAAITYERNQKTPFPMPPKYRDAQIKLTNNEIDQMPWYMIGTRFVAPGVLPSIIPENREINRRERIIALALAAYRTRHHQYPSTLKSLEKFWGSALPKDLYGEKPFHYRSDGKTFHLYSIGKNWIDDGGRPPKPPYNDDIEWKNNTPS